MTKNNTILYLAGQLLRVASMKTARKSRVAQVARRLCQAVAP